MRTARPTVNNVAEVQLRVRWVSPAVVPLYGHQWRIESEDGSILSLGQERDFRRELPVGKYKVEVRVRRDANGPMFATRGTLSLTSHDATMLQRLSAMK